MTSRAAGRRCLAAPQQKTATGVRVPSINLYRKVEKMLELSLFSGAGGGGLVNDTK